MAVNFTEKKIEMICGRKMGVTTEIQMSLEMKTLLESDPKAAAVVRDAMDAIEAERRAEMEKKMNPDAKTEDSDSDSEDDEEQEHVREDRWNSPLPGREAKCVNLIKEIVAELKSSLPRVIGEY